MQETVYDVIIIGSGPAGYNAALYCSRGLLNVLLFEGELSGGQLITTTDVENYLGFPDGINGYELTEIFKNHALKFGTNVVSNKIIKVDFNKFPFEVTDEDNKDYKAKSVIICTGASAKRLGTLGEEKFWNNGISACAVCDGALPLFRNKPLIVVGGGDTACEEASHLAKFGSMVYMLLRGNEFRASKIMAERVKNNPKIKILYNTVLKEICGDKTVKYVKIENTVENKESLLDVNGVFYAIGHTPNTSIFKDCLDCNETGYIITLKGTQTNIPGIFAAGDVMDFKYRQAITAAGFGCMAAHDVQEWLRKL